MRFSRPGLRRPPRTTGKGGVVRQRRRHVGVSAGDAGYVAAVGVVTFAGTDRGLPEFLTASKACGTLTSPHLPPYAPASGASTAILCRAFRPKCAVGGTRRRFSLTKRRPAPDRRKEPADGRPCGRRPAEPAPPVT